MRVQLQDQSLRLRVDEAELARLLAGGTVCNITRWPDGEASREQLFLGSDDAWRRNDGGWCMMLTDSLVRELAARLPTREGLHVDIAVPDSAPLKVLFDVDVRDSAHRRFPGKHSGDKDAAS